MIGSESKHDAATVAATSGEAMEPIEIVGERRWVVGEAAMPGARVQAIAARYGICPSLVYRWRREGGDVDAANPSRVHLFPVRIEAPSDCSPAGSPSRTMSIRRPGIIEIELGNGVRVNVDEGIGVAALRRVVSVLRG